jgi:hypothetical protein
VRVTGQNDPLIFDADSGLPLALEEKEGNATHVFLSHTQSSGQDLTTTINMSLKLACRDIVLFQDIDFEEFDDVHDLGHFCLQADVFLLILTEGVFNSWFVVVAELMTRMREGGEIVLVLDTDRRHGGGTLENFIEEARKSEVVRENCGTLDMTVDGFCHALRSYQVLVWHRKKGYRLVSVLKTFEAVTHRKLEWEGVSPLAALTIRPVLEGFTAHLGLSAHQVKSKRLMQALQDAYPDLITTLVKESHEFAKCERVVIVLGNNSFSSVEYTQHVSAAIDQRTEANLVPLFRHRLAAEPLCGYGRCFCTSRRPRVACRSVPSWTNARLKSRPHVHSLAASASLLTTARCRRRRASSVPWPPS